MYVNRNNVKLSLLFRIVYRYQETQSTPGKYSPYHESTTPSLKCFHLSGAFHEFMLFDPVICIMKQQMRFIGPEYFFQSSSDQFYHFLIHNMHIFLLFCGTKDTLDALLLLKSIVFKVCLDLSCYVIMMFIDS